MEPETRLANYYFRHSVQMGIDLITYKREREMNATVVAEHRKREDRRSEDLGPPPGVEEQRLMPERRHPQVEHIDFVEHVEVLAVSDEQGKRGSSLKFAAR